jgi:hypothetical protein
MRSQDKKAPWGFGEAGGMVNGGNEGKGEARNEEPKEKLASSAESLPDSPESATGLRGFERIWSGTRLKARNGARGLEASIERCGGWSNVSTPPYVGGISPRPKSISVSSSFAEMESKAEDSEDVIIRPKDIIARSFSSFACSCIRNCEVLQGAGGLWGGLLKLKARGLDERAGGEDQCIRCSRGA